MQMYTVRARLQTFEEQFVMSYGSLPLPSDRPAAVVEVTALPDRGTWDLHCIDSARLVDFAV